MSLFFIVLISLTSIYAQDNLVGAEILDIEDYKIEDTDFPEHLAKKVYSSLHDPASFFETVRYYENPSNKRDAIHAYLYELSGKYPKVYQLFIKEYNLKYRYLKK